LGKQALLHGKHLLVEKPLAMSSQECDELIALAAQQKRVLMVGHTFLHNPAVKKLKELTAQDHLGRLLYLYCHRVNLGRVQTDINALWSIAPHDISIALYLTGQMPVEVCARGASYLTHEIEDVVFLTLVFPEGILAHIHVSWIDPSKVRRVTVVGSKRMAVFDDLADEGKVKVYDKGVVKSPNGPLYGEFHYRLHSGDIHIPKVPMEEPLAVECAHFIECIREQKQPLSNGENGLQVVRVLEAAQQSLQHHGVPIKLLPDQGVTTGVQRRTVMVYQHSDGEPR
jgi:predicted dehydrogenase